MSQKRINIRFEILLCLLKEENYGRALSKKIGIPLSNIQRTINELKEENILNLKLSGKNKIYSIKKNLVSKREIFNAENYKFIKLVEKHPFLEQIFEKIVKYDCKLIILFGSYAKFNAKKESDIDIYVETEDEKIKREIGYVDSRINLKIGAFDSKDLLIKEIIKNHIIIKGVEEYYEKTRYFNEA